MVVTLSKTFRFEAAHRLPNHDGKCQRLHGHSWKLTVRVEGDDLHTTGPKRGMLVDYSDLKRLVSPLIEQYLDHHYLNDTLRDLADPTSEAIAGWVYTYLTARWPPAWQDRVRLRSITINETCTSACTLLANERLMTS